MKYLRNETEYCQKQLRYLTIGFKAINVSIYKYIF